MIYERSSQRNLFPYYACIFYTLLFIQLSPIQSPVSINLEDSSRILVEAINSINYGITQQAITDVNQLMPKLCQNQSVICEGSFCIPNIRRCVCDLRMPVQFGRYCLRQIDIETKCFATSQCNHTIKDAVCLDINSNSILDTESSKFKLDQWQQLNELRQMSQSATSNKAEGQQSSVSERPKKAIPIMNRILGDSHHMSTNNVIFSNVRNSPYEINYNTPELLLQNHTRRRIDNSDRSIFNSISTTRETKFEENMLSSITSNDISSAKTITTTTPPNHMTNQPTTTRSSPSSETKNSISNFQAVTERSNSIISSTTYSEQVSKKKVIKNPYWPPGICSCPLGFMFDSMLRKCLALSLADSHCVVDNDCKQIAMTHCSGKSKKCDCDEPLEWIQKDMACMRPKPTVKNGPSTIEKDGGSFIDSLITPMTLARLFPDYTTLLVLFVILVIIGTLIILKLTVKCFSSSSSALISPKIKSKKTASNNLPPKSPYATLRRPEHKPSSQLSNFAQVTRGRILNYDFEEESRTELAKSPSTSQAHKSGKTSERVGTLKTPASHKHQPDRSSKSPINVDADGGNQFIELNDNISVSQLESESKSDNSILTIPGPSPNQPPPYMLASTMKGQGSAIAAAAAAVANKRMQLAQKKNHEQQQQVSKHSNKDPVFL